VFSINYLRQFGPYFKKVQAKKAKEYHFFTFFQFFLLQLLFVEKSGEKGHKCHVFTFFYNTFVSQHITGGMPLPHQMTSLPTPSFFASTRYGFITLILLRPKMTLLLVFIRTLSVSYSLTNPKDQVSVLLLSRGGWGKTPMRGKMPKDNILQVSNSLTLVHVTVTLASVSFMNRSYSLKVNFVSIYKL